MAWKAVIQRFERLHFSNLIQTLSFQRHCIVQVKTLEGIALMAGRDDIPYNFLIGNDGLYYEGRGEHIEGELTETESYSNLGLIVAFIGNFTEVVPTKQTETLKILLQRFYTLTPSYNILFEGQLPNTKFVSTQTIVALKEMSRFHDSKFNVNLNFNFYRFLNCSEYFNHQ